MSEDSALSSFEIEQFKKAFLTEAKKAGLKDRVQILSLRPHRRHANSVGYVLRTTIGTYYVKTVLPNTRNRVFPEIPLHGVMVAERMALREENERMPIGSFVIDGGEQWIIPLLHEGALICQIQRYYPGRSFLKIVKETHRKEGIDAEDEKNISGIVDCITKIHSSGYELQQDENEETLAAIYNTYLETVLSKRAVQLPYAQKNELLDWEFEKILYSHTLDNISLWRSRGDRVRRAHGDFWWANASRGKDGWRLDDNSKFPYADPALDLSWWALEHLWWYFQTGNERYKKLWQLFFDLYQAKMKDAEIERAMCVGVSLKMLVKLNPKNQKGADLGKALLFRNHCAEMLRQKTFFWP